jgi:hypothetical protein
MFLITQYKRRKIAASPTSQSACGRQAYAWLKESVFLTAAAPAATSTATTAATTTATAKDHRFAFAGKEARCGCGSRSPFTVQQPNTQSIVCIYAVNA